MMTENYVYKKEVDWSLLTEGFTLPNDYQVIFGQIMGRFLSRGETKNITLYLNGKSYSAQIRSLNLDPKWNRKKGMLQIRYSKNGELARALQACFFTSYQYIKAKRENRDPSSRERIRVPEEYREYLAIYTTEYDDSYVVETIQADDLQLLKETVNGQPERVMENAINYETRDETAGIILSERFDKIRKLDRKIGDNLKLLYGYRCQICGQLIGEEYGAHVIEAHHIDYFVSSLNNDADNQMIVCPNHHRIIHEVNPVFDRVKRMYVYENGLKQGLLLNRHL